MKKPVLLMILDGFGLREDAPDNAVSKAKTPNYDKLLATRPHAQLRCSGLDVGLPDGQMGNSEVGHTNMGAGRIVYQDLTRISKAIDDGDFFENGPLCAAVDNCLENGKALHLMGLLSDGGVHSHMKHWQAMLELCRRKGLDRVYVHAFLDGRDVPPTSGAGFIAQIEAAMKEKGVGAVSDVCGRYYGMDREKHYERNLLAYKAIVDRQAEQFDTADEAVAASYEKGVTDEFMIPVIIKGGEPVRHGDSIVFMNFRPDRARQITRAFVDPDFEGFERDELLEPVYVCMTEYDATIPNVSIAFPPQSLKNTLGEYVSELGLTQLRIAEYTKYAHVTFFFNGGAEQPYPGEDRVLIDSPNVATYDLKPEMSAFEVAAECAKRIESGKYDLIILNFANCDMVGHTGIMQAAVKAVEAVDTCMGKVLRAVKKVGGCAIVTADHGNAEQMGIDVPVTSHTTNPVPVILVGCDRGISDGALCDLAPTLLELMGLEKPAEMSGHSLLI